MSEPLADTLPLTGHLGRTIGKFRLERRLGSGAMGDVFLGVHTALGSLVAIKILNATATAEPELDPPEIYSLLKTLVAKP